MLNNLMKLYNTMSMVETKGESTKTMANCLNFLEQMIVELNNQNVPCDGSDETVEEEIQEV